MRTVVRTANDPADGGFVDIGHRLQFLVGVEVEPGSPATFTLDKLGFPTLVESGYNDTELEVGKKITSLFFAVVGNIAFRPLFDKWMVIAKFTHGILECLDAFGYGTVVLLFLPKRASSTFFCSGVAT